MPSSWADATLLPRQGQASPYATQTPAAHLDKSLEELNSSHTKIRTGNQTAHEVTQEPATQDDKMVTDDLEGKKDRGTSSSGEEAEQQSRSDRGNGVHDDKDRDEDDQYEEEDEEDADEEEEDNSDEDDDDDDDDDTSGVESGDESKMVFDDEKFMALFGLPTQLGPSQSSGPASDRSMSLQHQQLPFQPADVASSLILPQSAPTPSDEFYDGAINFLTEVLGSSDPSIWEKGGDTPWQSAETPSTLLNAAETRPSQASNSHAQSEENVKSRFRSLQPLINNLIARLKGEPTAPESKPTALLEDDMVMLLQTLMAQRQAQRDRNRNEHGREQERQQEIAKEVEKSPLEIQQQPQTVRSWPLNSGQGQEMMNSVSDPSLGASPLTNELGQISNGVSGNQMAKIDGNATAGFSIVDFDFGDDDDDPDFDPSKMGLFDFSSLDFANAFPTTNESKLPDLATVSLANEGLGDPSLPETSMERTGGLAENAWQQLMTLNQNAEVSNSNASTSSPCYAAPRDPTISAPGGQSKSFVGEKHSNAQNSQNSREESRSSSAEASKSRFIYSREEAAERRRECNRECARRQRQRKKEEQEEMKRQLELAKKATPGMPVHIELPAKRKVGRPLGSKARAREASEQASKGSEQESLSATEVADLRADNRMIRAELSRLREENAQLRAQVIQWEVEQAKREAERSGRHTGRIEMDKRASHKGKRGVAGLFQWDGDNGSHASPSSRRRRRHKAFSDDDDEDDEDDDDADYLSEVDQSLKKRARQARPSGRQNGELRRERSDGQSSIPTSSSRLRQGDSNDLSLNRILESGDGRALEALLQVVQEASAKGIAAS